MSLWSTYGFAVEPRPLDVAELFGRRAPLVVEIGFGTGTATAHMAAAEPQRDLIAVDVHRPGIGNLLRHIDDRALHNVRVADGDGFMLLRDMLAPHSVEQVRLYFPDPWPKRAHHKRRLVNASFAQIVASRLAPGGLLHIATDWADYAEHVLTVLRAEPALQLEHDGASPRPSWRPVTKFEQRGLDAGHTITDILARKL
ncbi:MAG TPA: tRNA (guanosine(46)-N7)-methyltransferase TrmB [Jiangellaceae bacterium]|nr:tRNA (guanosine(46)-N7)-methyltransferase TrmB [Jiangellaceae bacterium]